MKKKQKTANIQKVTPARVLKFPKTVNQYNVFIFFIIYIMLFN